MQRLEAHDLICRAISGDTLSRDTLITYYCQSLVPGLASSWTRLADDAVSIGNLAVVEAIDSGLLSYDPDSENGLASYLKKAIIRALSHADYNVQTIPTPRRPERTPKQRLSLSTLTEPIESTTPESLAIAEDMRDKLRQIFGEVLSARDAGIMCSLYIEDCTARDTALMFECSIGLVDKVRRNAIRVLRQHGEFRSLLSV